MDHIHMLSNAIRPIFLKLEFKLDKKIASKGILGNKLNFIGLVLTLTKWMGCKISKQYKYKTKWSSLYQIWNF